MRLHLTLALITALALFLTLRLHRGHHFGFAQIDEIARMRATAKYVPPPDVLPPQLKKLSPQMDAGIFAKETARLWHKKGLPFQIDFYPQLNSNPQPHIAPSFNLIDSRGRDSHLAYSHTFFNFLNVTTNPPQPLFFNPPLPADLGYAGFYVRYPDMAIGSNASLLDGFFTAMGGSYFRVIAKEQVYGLSARGIAIDSHLEGKKNEPPEEFPAFVAWWLHEPDPNASALVLDALLDGPSVTGAYEFTIHPGAVSSVDVHASLYFRAAVEQLGIAPFSSMYLFGENAKDHFGDNVHPEIHDSDGVLMNTGSSEWVWHPLQQTPFLQSYSFVDQNPRGFGLIQRDRDFAHYQDLNDKYNVRPSAWVIPHSDWGHGKIQLMQLNSNDFNTDNVVMFWSPDKPVKRGDHLDLGYTINFYMNDANLPPLAYVKQTLINCPAPPPPEVAPLPSKPFVGPPLPPPKLAASAAKPKGSTPPAPPPPAPPPPSVPGQPPIPTGTVPVQFLVDFVGDGIENIAPTEKLDIDLTYGPPGTYLREKTVEKNGYDKSWRVIFTIIPLKHFTPTELRCRLLHNGRPLTETWSYTWHQ